MIKKVEDDPLKRYQLLAQLGEGTFGRVLMAKDQTNDAIIVIKRYTDAFNDVEIAKRVYREIVALRGLQGHENIVRFQSLIKAKEDKGVFLIFEKMPCNLKHNRQAKESERRLIMYQLLKVLKYMHSAGLIHGHLQPSQILVDTDLRLKLTGFDNVYSDDSPDRQIDPTDRKYNYDPYMAPEIMLGAQKYSKAADIWSIGCILGELLLGRFLFLYYVGITRIEEMVMLLGRPTADDIEAMNAPSASAFFNGIELSKTESFESRFSSASEDEIDLLKKMLVYNPFDRITVEEALRHNYFKEIASIEKEKICDNVIKLGLGDDAKLTVNDYRKAIYEEISKMKEV